MRAANAYTVSFLLHATVLTAGCLVVALDAFDVTAYPMAGGGGGKHRFMPPGKAGGSPRGGTVYFEVSALKPAAPRAQSEGVEFLREAVPLVSTSADASEEKVDPTPHELKETEVTTAESLETARTVPVSIAVANGDGPRVVAEPQPVQPPKATPVAAAKATDDRAGEQPQQVARSQSASLPPRQVSVGPSQFAADVEVPAGPPLASGRGGSVGGIGGGNDGAGGGGGAGGGDGHGLDGLPRQGPTNLPPLYPADALAAGFEGRVLLRVLVNAGGRVDKLSVERSAGWPSLDQAALVAVRDWRFFPARRAGVAVAFEVLVPVRFSIRER